LNRIPIGLIEIPIGQGAIVRDRLRIKGLPDGSRPCHHERHDPGAKAGAGCIRTSNHFHIYMMNIGLCLQLDISMHYCQSRRAIAVAQEQSPQTAADVLLFVPHYIIFPVARIGWNGQ
jgi:hypothetical protein